MIPVANLCGQDLAYWVARANATTSREARNILRRHYGSGPSRRSLHEEVAMREFVEHDDALVADGLTQGRQISEVILHRRALTQGMDGGVFAGGWRCSIRFVAS